MSRSDILVFNLYAIFWCVPRTSFMNLDLRQQPLKSIRKEKRRGNQSNGDEKRNTGLNGPIIKFNWNTFLYSQIASVILLMTRFAELWQRRSLWLLNLVLALFSRQMLPICFMAVVLNVCGQIIWQDWSVGACLLNSNIFLCCRGSERKYWV